MLNLSDHECATVASDLKHKYNNEIRIKFKVDEEN